MTEIVERLFRLADGKRKTRPKMDCDHKKDSCIFSHYPVVELTLSFLTWKDLCKCARVCRLWSDVVRKLKVRRQTMAFTVLKADESEESFAALAQQTINFFENLYSRPKTVLMFCCYLLVEKVTCTMNPGSSRRPRNETMTYEQLVRSLVPEDCLFMGLEAAGVVGTSRDLEKVEEVEEDYGVSFLCLPQYTGSDRLEVAGSSYPGDVTPDLSTEIIGSVGGQEIKSTFLFYAHFHGALNYAYDLLKKHPCSDIAGAYVERIVTNFTIPPEEDSDNSLNEQSDKEMARLQMALYGNNVQIASIIIPEAASDAQAAESYIKKLKNVGLPETERTFALMFACLGRGEGWYGETNVESSIFRKHFPRIPLVGVFGNGEIGCDFPIVPEDEDGGRVGQRKRCRKDHPTLYHSYTSVFVLVSVT